MISYLCPFRFPLLLVFLVVPLQAQREQRPEGPTNLQVYVFFENNRPAGQQLRVEMTNASGIPVTQGFTDSSGRTVLQAPGSGGYILKVSGESVQKDAAESVEVFYCPAQQCTRVVQVHVKAKAETTEH